MNRDLYKPTVLRAYLESLGVTPKKSLGQHFLIDQNILQRIIKTADVSEGDNVLEIGPGPGVLTDFLLETGAQVTAIERDHLYAEEHRKRNIPALTIIEDDVLNVDLSQVLDPAKKYKLVANLPYNISTPIFDKIFQVIHLFSSMTVMVQKEVGDRMRAQAGTKDYGALSLFIQLHGEATGNFQVSSKSFYPPPNVTSAVIHVELKKKSFDVPNENIQKLVRHLFTKRRKMIRGTLRDLCEKDHVAEVLKEANIAETARPETLTIAEFARLAKALQDIQS